MPVSPDAHDQVCPQCGYEGPETHCPQDGTPLAPRGTPYAPPDATRPPPVERTDIKHAPALGGDNTIAEAPSQPKLVGRLPSAGNAQHEALRDENFGQWAEPEVKKKQDTLIGRTISDRYEVHSLIGKGGMGAVYKARQPAVQRDIALKVLLEEFVQNETIVKRFYQEALAASRLNHPNTIKIYDFGQSEDGVLYIAMEYLQGKSLQQVLAQYKSGLPPKRAIYIMRQVCKSLAEAHRAGIIHRDLKPDNIFLTDIQGEQDFVKVLDFGVAKLKEYEGKEGTLTQAGMIFGTPKYMSPEQARSGELDARSDVYALGVILYELVAGRTPFGGDNPLSILIAHVNEQPKPFEALNPPVEVHPALAAVIFKALAKHPDGRHPDVDSLLGELEAVDELLEGADWAEVADRLPQLSPGAHGAPSLIGPAIVPVGQGGNLDGFVAGHTEILSGRADLSESHGDATAFDLTDPLAESEAPARARWPLILAALLPIAAGAWWFTRAPEEPPTPALVAQADATVAARASVDAGLAPPKADAAPAEAPADARVADAAVDLGPPPVVFTVVSEPKGARIVVVATNESLGASPKEVTLTAPTQLRLEKSGYKPHLFELDPSAEGSRLYTATLKAEAERVRPPRVTPKTPATSVSPRTIGIGTPQTPATKGHTPLELQ